MALGEQSAEEKILVIKCGVNHASISAKHLEKNMHHGMEENNMALQK